MHPYVSSTKEPLGVWTSFELALSPCAWSILEPQVQQRLMDVTDSHGGISEQLVPIGVRGCPCYPPSGSFRRSSLVVGYGGWLLLSNVIVIWISQRLDLGCESNRHRRPAGLEIDTVDTDAERTNCTQTDALDVHACADATHTEITYTDSRKSTIDMCVGCAWNDAKLHSQDLHRRKSTGHSDIDDKGSGISSCLFWPCIQCIGFPLREFAILTDPTLAQPPGQVMTCLQGHLLQEVRGLLGSRVTCGGFYR